jgi:DNA-binding CsgD family transcriptional regulator
MSLPERFVAALAEVSAVASSAQPVGDSAREVLEILRRVVPYAGATLCEWDSRAERHIELATIGYPPSVMDFALTRVDDREPRFRLMRYTDPAPLRWKDAPGDFLDSYACREVLMPVGYTDGMSALLHARDGRYTGALHVNTEGPRSIPESARVLTALLQPVLGGLVDERRLPALLAADLGDEVPAVLVQSRHDVEALAGHPSHPELAPGGGLVGLVSDLRDRPGQVRRFVWRGDGGQQAWVRTHRTHTGTVVSIEPFQPPTELTARELEVLTLVAHGHHNVDIAFLLTIGRRTVDTYVERLLVKLGCPSRVGLAHRALSLGLELQPPPGLAGPRPGTANGAGRAVELVRPRRPESPTRDRIVTS